VQKCTTSGKQQVLLPGDSFASAFVCPSRGESSPGRRRRVEEEDWDELGRKREELESNDAIKLLIQSFNMQ